MTRLTRDESEEPLVAAAVSDLETIGVMNGMES
mgnify:CR=1 FL=1